MERDIDEYLRDLLSGSYILYILVYFKRFTFMFKKLNIKSSMKET